MAIQFCHEHGVSCCSRRIINHCHFQCKYNSDSIISCYFEDKYECPDIEQVEKYIAYVAAHEIDSLIDKYVVISHEARLMKGHSSIILQLCKHEFSDNISIKERILAPKGTNILQKKGSMQRRD
jgi:predicted transcriptional regulator